MALAQRLRAASPPGRAARSPKPEQAARQRIIVALDVASKREALALVERLGGHVGMFKVGSQLFAAGGPSLVRMLVELGERVFLDLKFHDIPHVVAAACRQAAELGVSLVDVHATGGPAMLRAAREALDKHARPGHRPRLLAVTVLTSLAQRDLKGLGWKGSLQENVIRLARLAERAGCDGVVAAPTDVAAVRRVCGKDFLIVTPGIRLPGHKRMPDQARTATPAEAIRAGANYIVLGRALTESRAPLRTLTAIVDSMAGA